MKKDTVIGIDIGGTNTKIGIVDREGKSLVKVSIPTQKNNETIEDFVNALKDNIKDLMQKTGGEIDIKGIGIGAPNGNYYKGTIEEAPNLKWKGVIPLVDLLKEALGFSVITLTNDANAAAIGEMIYGAAQNMKNFVVITLGTGLGSGIVVNGELVYGHDGFAGELGHTTVMCGGRVCGTGKRGCLEAYASATGIVRTVFQIMADSMEPSPFRDIPFNELDAEMITDQAKKGDKIALEAFEYTGKILGKALANTVAHLSPEAIILFGGLANAGELLFLPTKKYMEEYVLNIFKNKISIVPSGIVDGANAAVLGASALVWKELSE